jgi:hypothetical protein
LAFKATAKDDCVVLSGELANDYQKIVLKRENRCRNRLFLWRDQSDHVQGWTPKPIRSSIEVDKASKARKSMFS